MKCNNPWFEIWCVVRNDCDTLGLMLFSDLQQCYEWWHRVYTLSTSLMGKQLTESSNTLVWRHLNKSEDCAWRNLARFNMEKWEVLFHCSELPCADWEVTGCEIHRIELECYRWCQAEGANMLLLGINRAVHLAEFWGDGPQSKKLSVPFTCHWQGHSGKFHSIWGPDIQNIHKEIGEDPSGLARCSCTCRTSPKRGWRTWAYYSVERRIRAHNFCLQLFQG